MPIVWRFLLGQFLKVLGLCVVTFMVILLTMRLEEIAQFAALGASPAYLLRFVWYQIPYVLPIALPIAALISAILLMQRLSQYNELTALRSSGYGLGHVITPLLLAAAFLSLGNLYIVSEVATHSHLMKRLLKKEIKALNPLVLLQNERLARLKGVYTHTFGAGSKGDQALDVLLAVYNTRQQSLNLVIAKQLQATPSSLEAHQVSLVAGVSASHDEGFDQLIVENAESLTLPRPDLSLLLGNQDIKLKNDHLKMGFLLARADELVKELHQAEANGDSTKVTRSLQRNIQRTFSEIVRRLSIALAVFSFSLMGVAFGLHISRTYSSTRLAVVIALAATFLAAFFAAKHLEDRFYIAMTLYLTPHIIIICASLWTLRRLSEGRE